MVAKDVLHFCSPSQQQNSTSMNKGVFEVIVGSSTICQGIKEKSHPLVHQAIGRQTMVLAVDPVVVHGLASAPLGCGPEAPREHWLRQFPRYERALVEVQVYREEVPAHYRSKKIRVPLPLSWLLVKTRGDDDDDYYFSCEIDNAKLKEQEKSG